jgi:multidrug efflux pump subunit AcrB
MYIIYELADKVKRFLAKKKPKRKTMFQWFGQVYYFASASLAFFFASRSSLVMGFLVTSLHFGSFFKSQCTAGVFGASAFFASAAFLAGSFAGSAANAGIANANEIAKMNLFIGRSFDIIFI